MSDERRLFDPNGVGERRSALLKQLARLANLSHRWAKASGQAAVEHAAAAGEALCRARELCERGEWAAWVRRNFDGSLRTAQRYVRLARYVAGTISNATHLSPLPGTRAASPIVPHAVGDAPVLAPVADRPVEAELTSLAGVVGQSSAGSLRASPPRRPRLATLAVSRLEQLAEHLAAQPEADAEAHVIGRVRALAADIHMDHSAGCPADAPGQVVYFVEAVGAERVKIGTAADAPSRIADLRTACPLPLRLLGTVEGGRDFERVARAFL